jgi:CheY-like chemotaxis protein
MSASYSKVLIADDSSAVHQLICSALSDDYSTSIVHAFDGLECLNALDDGVDLAFIDVHMPTMGGMDAVWAARIAGNKTFATLISGQANRRCIVAQLGAYEFLTSRSVPPISVQFWQPIGAFRCRCKSCWWTTLR